MLVTAVTEDALNVALGVLVGLYVLVGVTSGVGLAVRVAGGGRGVTVKVEVTGPRESGGNGLNDEWGLTKINRKYKPMEAVITSTRIESISHDSNGAPCGAAFRFLSKSKLSSIQFTPLQRGSQINIALLVQSILYRKSFIYFVMAGFYMGFALLNQRVYFFINLSNNFSYSCAIESGL